jgi:hypothetical protein
MYFSCKGKTPPFCLPLISKMEVKNKQLNQFVINLSQKQRRNSMKRSMMLITILTILFVSICQATDYQNKMMTIRMNGHDHQVHDVISDTLNQLYANQVPNIRHCIDSALSSYLLVPKLCLGTESIEAPLQHVRQ